MLLSGGVEANNQDLLRKGHPFTLRRITECTAGVASTPSVRHLLVAAAQQGLVTIQIVSRDLSALHHKFDALQLGDVL